MEKRRHIIDLLFIVVLVGAFTLFSVALVVLGANVYKKTVSHNQEAYQTRTASLYFNQKLHQADQENGIRLAAMENGCKALVLDDEENETWIFLSDGQLREATVKPSTPVTESFGQPVLSLQSLQFRPLAENLLRITAVSPKGIRSQVDILVRGSELEVPK